MRPAQGHTLKMQAILFGKELWIMHLLFHPPNESQVMITLLVASSLGTQADDKMYRLEKNYLVF